MLIPLAAALGLVLLNSDPISEDSSANLSKRPILNFIQRYLKEIDNDVASIKNETQNIQWNFFTNITDENEQKMVQQMKLTRLKGKSIWNKTQHWRLMAPLLPDARLRRQIRSIPSLQATVLPEEKYEKLTQFTTDLRKMYSRTNICDFHNPTKCDLAMHPDIVNILKTSRNHEQLLHVWKQWRDKSGKQMKSKYSEIVQLWNEVARANGHPNAAQMWIRQYESKFFEKEMHHIFQFLFPLYSQLHAYFYGTLVPITGAIPAHLLGNMWAQDWSNIYPIVAPFPNKEDKDISLALKEQGYDAKKMFSLADDFFVSMGLEKVPESFWKKSIFEKPIDRETTCHASAWDFATGDDFRIHQCTQIDEQNLIIAHHEMGHIQYFMLYKNQPVTLQRGANPGFHEAVGDVIALSLTTQKHLKKIGLLPNNIKEDHESDINGLMKTALKKIAILPFAYIMDRWRWDTFRGYVQPANYTCAWWNYRYHQQGVSPPLPRTEEDFDPGAKFHIAANVPYIRYFVSHILQFQFYESACRIAGEYDPKNPDKPLHRCDLYGSKKAGKAFGDMLRLGSSVDWRKALKRFVGTPRIDPRALRDYFRPLELWLREDNRRHGEYIGWKGATNFCKT